MLAFRNFDQCKRSGYGVHMTTPIARRRHIGSLNPGWWGTNSGDSKPDRDREVSSIDEPRTDRSRKT